MQSCLPFFIISVSGRQDKTGGITMYKHIPYSLETTNGKQPLLISTFIQMKNETPSDRGAMAQNLYEITWRCCLPLSSKEPQWPESSWRRCQSSLFGIIFQVCASLFDSFICEKKQKEGLLRWLFVTWKKLNHTWEYREECNGSDSGVWEWS